MTSFVRMGNRDPRCRAAEEAHGRAKIWSWLFQIPTHHLNLDERLEAQVYLKTKGNLKLGRGSRSGSPPGLPPARWLPPAEPRAHISRSVAPAW